MSHFLVPRCWPSQQEMDSMDPLTRETIYRIEIGNHSQRTLASGKIVFGLKYAAGSDGGGCTPPPGTQIDQEDVVLLPPLDPGKSFDVFAINESNRCVWLIPPNSATVKMDGEEKESQRTLTLDKSPLYASGAPVLSPASIKWEGIPTKPAGYAIIRSASRACENNSEVR